MLLGTENATTCLRKIHFKMYIKGMRKTEFRRKAQYQ